MYERSAIVLEKYFKDLFGFNKKINLKTNYNNYSTIIADIEKYQLVVEEEENIIKEFDEIAENIQKIQKNQEKLYNSNLKLEEDRNQLFNDFDDSPSELDKKLEKIKISIEKNNEEMNSLKDEFIKYMEQFNERQKERNKCSKNKRVVEGEHFATVEKVTRDLEAIDDEAFKNVKNFIKSDESRMKEIEDELNDIMIENGKEEKVKFDENAIKIAVKERLSIAKRQAECYVAVYDKMKKLLSEVNNDNIKLAKHQKTLRDVSVKIEFLTAEKTYIVNFLDNERMTALNGDIAHKEMMIEACENFTTDIDQINSLYELILREISGRASKKAYKDLYNKPYLKEIEEKEKSFKEEANSIKIKAGTLINSNYWRIDGIKNIYNVFEEEVQQKFETDLSEYWEDEKEELEVEEIINQEDDELLDEEIFKSDSIFLKNEEELDEQDIMEDEQYKENTENFEDDFDDDGIEDEEDIEELEEIIEEDYFEDEEDDESDEDEEDEYIFESDSIFLKKENFEEDLDEKLEDGLDEQEDEEIEEKIEDENEEEVKENKEENEEKEGEEKLDKKKNKKKEKNKKDKESKGIFKHFFKEKEDNKED